MNSNSLIHTPSPNLSAPISLPTCCSPEFKNKYEHAIRGTCASREEPSGNEEPAELHHVPSLPHGYAVWGSTVCFYPVPHFPSIVCLHLGFCPSLPRKWVPQLLCELFLVLCPVITCCCCLETTSSLCPEITLLCFFSSGVAAILSNLCSRL